MEERLSAALMLKRIGMHCPLLVDTLANEAANAYAAMPERLYLIEDGLVSLASKKGPLHYVTTIREIEIMFKKKYQ